jgi:hypothetical protein
VDAVKAGFSYRFDPFVSPALSAYAQATIGAASEPRRSGNGAGGSVLAFAALDVRAALPLRGREA